ncbi:MAG: hypothetical protein AAFR87_01650 [Bacteroidota bacterium]
MQTGQKVIISDVEGPSSYFGNTIDLLSSIHKEYSPATSIPLKTAASLGARFPMVTSAGRIYAVASPKDTVGDKMAKRNFETFQQLME